MKIEINQQFGQLKVIKQDITPRKDKHKYWICECSCGKRISVRSTLLSTGKKISCGCHKGYYDKKIINLSNQRFGKIVALYPSSLKSGTHIMWHCKCDCGIELDIDGHSLRHGLSTSCGCGKISKGEQKIKNLLDKYHIPYVQEKTFPSCRYPKTNALLRFDFYINNQYLIEYDGIQHFKNNGYWDTEKIKQYDKYKNNWAIQNNILLIRIPYTHYDEINIKDLLVETSHFIINKKINNKKGETRIMLKENSRKIYDYVKANDGENFTAADIADALGLPVKSVNGSITAAFQRHTEVVDGEKVTVPLMERVEAEVEAEDGTHAKVKFIRLTDAGRKFNPDAE